MLLLTLQFQVLLLETNVVKNFLKWLPKNLLKRTLKQELLLALVVMDTHVRHSNATSAYSDRRTSCEEAALAMGVSALRDVDSEELERHEGSLDEETYRRARHIVSENDRVLKASVALRARDFKRVGELFRSSHISMRDDYEISSPELDLAVECAEESGALVARMTGGGFGGSAIAIISADRLGELESRLV